MRNEKLFQKIKIHYRPDYIQLKNRNGRDVHMLLCWSEYPRNEFGDNISEFNGNILNFYTHIRNLQMIQTNRIPVIYEIMKEEKNKMPLCILYSNHNSIHNKFISRQAKLHIRYKFYNEEV